MNERIIFIGEITCTGKTAISKLSDKDMKNIREMELLWLEKCIEEEIPIVRFADNEKRISHILNLINQQGGKKWQSKCIMMKTVT